MMPRLRAGHWYSGFRVQGLGFMYVKYYRIFRPHTVQNCFNRIYVYKYGTVNTGQYVCATMVLNDYLSVVFTSCFYSIVAT